MLNITITIGESFNEETAEFVTSEAHTLVLEHSLVSLSKWESKWELPFLATEKKTDEQVLDYVRMMILSEIPPEVILSKLSGKIINEINAYINAKMTATWFHEAKQPKTKETVTAEVIYYWMISLGIPFECENWHLNRLLTLIKVCNIKNAPKDEQQNRMSMAEQRSLNEQRRKELGTRG